MMDSGVVVLPGCPGYGTNHVTIECTPPIAALPAPGLGARRDHHTELSKVIASGVTLRLEAWPTRRRQSAAHTPQCRDH